MPPRKASPATCPASPPSVSLPAPIIKKRVLPDFISLNSTKKRINFDSMPLEPLDSILEETTPEVTAEWGPIEPAVDIFSEMCNLRTYLEEVVKSRSARMRMQNGEVFVDDIPDEFNLDECDAPTDLSTKAIYDFIWKHAPEERTVFGTREVAEYFLSCEPWHLLRVLNIALGKAEVALMREKEEPPTVDIFFEMCNLQIYLEEVVQSMDAGTRVDNGEIFVDAIPDAFNLGQCDAPTDVGTKEIFDFIWTHAPEEKAAYGTREKAEHFLSCEPIHLLRILKIALGAAEAAAMHAEIEEGMPST